jgi:hypothetical protein
MISFVQQVHCLHQSFDLVFKLKDLVLCIATREWGVSRHFGGVSIF